MTHDENSGQDADPVENAFARWAAKEQEEIAHEQADELAHRRAFNALMARYQQLTPEKRARMETEITVFDDAEASLKEGRAAYTRGDLALAEARMRVAAGHGLADSTVYLAAIYHHQGKPELAEAWRVIAEADGLHIDDIANPPTD
ncbi:hypothetical protein MOQ72_42255 [Saccharopolyspora sp. K220]|uniref:hypothetical protein n=1 Tax=Saccharopolyspora soli TaxID=2926618 RepID=UPI001F57613C|nr:hypothetical protein [Saccharopolyspora soli]MCI2424042.1 hypothetical protein [Saccharopolyspora soli]